MATPKTPKTKPTPGGVGERAPVVVRQTKRAGLHLYESVSLRPRNGMTPEESAEFMRAVRTLSPRARIEHLEARAKDYPADPAVQGELRWILDHFSKQNLGLAVSYAMTALERGLALLDTGKHLPTVTLGQKFKAGRKQGTGSRLRKEVAKHLRRKPSAKAAEIWDAIKQKPPRGFAFYEGNRHLGPYVEDGTESTGYRRFQNIVSEERKKFTG